MSEILINDLVEELSEENKRLLNELSFERQLNEMLENLRKYSLDLKTNCFCHKNKQTFDLLDQLDIEYKTFTQRIKVEKQLDQKTRQTTRKQMVSTCEESNESEVVSKSVKSYQRLSTSLLKKNMKRKSDSNETQLKKTSNNSDLTAKPFKCHFIGCGKEYTNSSHLKRHFKKYHNYVCNQRLKSSSLTRNIKSKSDSNGTPLKRKYTKRDSTEETFKCDFIGCDKECKQLSNLKRHQQTHSADRQLKCDVNGCDYSCIMKWEMDTHMNRHNGVQPYVCTHESCGKRFYGEQNLRTHLSTHYSKSSDKPYVCDYNGCGKRYPLKRYLNQHKYNTHSTGGARIRCPEPGCDLTFKCADSLKSHRYKHLDQVHACVWPGCTHSTNNPMFLRAHVREMHTPECRYVCEWPGCDYRTRTSDRLKMHRTSHSADKPYACVWPECGQRFKSRHNVRQHMIVHSGPLVPCGYTGCQFATKHKYWLKEHRKRAHGVVE